MIITLIFIVSLLLTSAYVALMYTYSRGWELQDDFTMPYLEHQPALFISVIIPARNEEKNIGACLASMLNQDYPKDRFEIIVVDDHSDDDTALIVSSFANRNVRCIKLFDYLGDKKEMNSFKKAALTAGVKESKGELIVTTDADCIAPNHWLRYVEAISQKEQSLVVVAPVIFSCDDSLLQIFQLIDFMSMQGITAAAHRMRLGNMSNGANFAFSKDAFHKVGGYKGVDQLASGDDYLLMMKLNKMEPGRVSYLKTREAIITTTPQPDWRSFLQQRIRWASKSGKYDDTRLTLILILVYLFNLSFLVVFIAGFFDAILFRWLAGMLLIKILSELVFLRPVAKFFGKESVLKYHPFLQPLHIVYIVIAGLLGFAGGYKWKGRRVR